jgi:hypothetical protein
VATNRQIAKRNAWVEVMPGSLKRIVVAAALLMIVCAPVARAEVVQEFNYQLKDLKPYGGFTVVFSFRGYDTTGAAPPPLTSAFLRLPAGAKIRREFLTKRFLCDVKKLNQTKDPKTCRNAEVGRGRVLVDTRPFTTETIPAKIYLFLAAKGTERTAVASIAILAIPDESAPIVRNNPFIREAKVVLRANFFNDPTPDGLFGYKLVLPTGPIRGVNISVAEVNVTVPGLTLTKRQRTCVKRIKGRCAKSRVKTRKLYWFVVPKCPPSGKFAFQAVFGYAALPTATRMIELSCPRFER